VIARGRYIVNGPAHCSNCHVASAADMIRSDAGELVPMQGGVVFALGPIGTMSPPNLTPDSETGIGGVSNRRIFLSPHAEPNGSPL